MYKALITILVFQSSFVFAQYGNPYGNTNNSNKVYGADGKYKGNLNDNPYDPNSVSNPYGRYGSQYSPDSINNPYKRTPQVAPALPNLPELPNLPGN